MTIEDSSFFHIVTNNPVYLYNAHVRNLFDIFSTLRGHLEVEGTFFLTTKQLPKLSEILGEPTIFSQFSKVEDQNVFSVISINFFV